MRTKSERVLSEVRKIWFRVMSIYYRSENRSVRIPSSNELAAEFGIAGSTVRLALKKLAEEGYLIMRKGAGSYTNPVCMAGAGMNKKKPLIGLLILTGDLFFYMPSVLDMIGDFSKELSRSGWNIRFVTERCASPEETEEVLRHAYLDGLFCVSVGEGIAEKAAELLPTVNLHFDVKNVPSIYSSYDGMIEKLLELSGRRRNLLAWVLNKVPLRYPLLRCFAGIPGLRFFRKVWNVAVPDWIEAFRKEVAAEGCPDWIVLPGEAFEAIRSIVCELYGEKSVREILWLFENTPNPDPSWPGYLICVDNTERMRMAVEMMRELLNTPSEPVASRSHEVQLVRISDKKRIV